MSTFIFNKTILIYLSIKSFKLWLSIFVVNKEIDLIKLRRNGINHIELTEY